MKKFLSLGLAVIALISLLWIPIGNAGAKGLIRFVDGRFVWGKGVVFVFEASGYRNKDVRNASILVGSNFHDLYCTVDKEKQNIVCVAGGNLTDYAGQTGVIYLAGQIFYVTIPDRNLPEQTQQPLVCGEMETMGAEVTFQVAEGNPITEFVSGSSLADVQQSAQNIMDTSEGFVISFEIVGSLECRVIIPS